MKGYARLEEIREQIAEKFNLSADAAPPRAVIAATPFVWKDPAAIPVREWLYGRHHIRRYCTGTVSPGGLGKSSLALVEGVSMVSGRDLLGVKPYHPLKVWYWNGEDPREEIDRRIAAACAFHDITREEIEGRLFIDSGRDCEIVIASETKDGATINTSAVEDIEATIQANGIDLMILDPFISSHRVSENDNAKVAMVIKTWAGIADRCNIGIEFVHHVRKGNGNTEVTVDDGRGAGAFKDHLRAVRVLNVMTAEEADSFGVPRKERTRYFRVDTGKANLAPPTIDTIWRKLEDVSLGNGRNGGPDDRVGVVDQWHCPGVWGQVTNDDVYRVQQEIARSQEWRQSPQSDLWVGNCVAKVLGLDSENKADRSRIKQFLQAWFGSGLLVVNRRRDDQRREREYVEVGKWIGQ